MTSIYSDLHPSLQKIIESEEELTKKEKEEAQKEAFDYVNPEYQNISDEDLEDVQEYAKDVIEDHIDDLEDELKTKWELTDNEAEEYALEAYQNYLDDLEKNKDEKDDPIEQEFMEEIDKIDGNNGEILEHLTQHFELDPEKVEELAESVNWNMMDIVLRMTDLVRKKRLKEKIEEESDKSSDNSIDDLFLKMFGCLSEIVSTTHNILSNKLIESTAFGNKYLSRIKSIIDNYIEYNNELDQKLQENIKPSLKKLQILIETADNHDSPTALFIMKTVFKEKDVYDEEDRRNVHIACTQYNQLYQELQHRIHQLRVKYIDFRQLNMTGFKLPKVKE